MMRAAATILVSAISVSLLAGGTSSASEIFSWVDADGVVNFSDWAPEDKSVAVSKLYVRKSNPPGYDPNEDDNSILEQADRMSDRWSELKELRDERRKQQQQAAERNRVPRYPDYNDSYYNRYGYYFAPIQRLGFGHRPPFKTQIRQAAALDRLGLLGGPRPHSINSSAHLARVNAPRSVSPVSRPVRHSGFRRPASHKEL